jgi:hypothetical protein
LTESVANVLETWIDEGQFKSRFHGPTDSHDKKLEAQSAAAIEPVARGVQAMMASDSHVLRRNVRFLSEMPRTYLGIASDDARMIVLFNNSAQDCSCIRPVGTDDFAPSARLGLKAVTLFVDPQDPDVNELGLVLSLRDGSDSNAGFNIVQFTVQGDIRMEAHTSTYYKDGLVQYNLGLIPAEQVWALNVRTMPMADDKCIGFPGATDYLVSHLPHLAHYYTKLAGLIAPDHALQH